MPFDSLGRREIIQYGGVAMGSALLAGCSGNGGSDAQPSDTLTARHTYDFVNLDPVHQENVTDRQICANIFTPLIGYELGTTNLSRERSLADDWEFNENGDELTLALKEGIQFHDDYGELTTADVEYHFDRILEGSPRGVELNDLNFEAVEVEDDYTCTLVFEDPALAAEFQLGTPLGMIPSADAIDDIGENQFASNPIGTGPFEFVEHVADERTELAAFDDYHVDGVPAESELVFRVIPEDATAASSFDAGEIDVFRVNSSDRLSSYEDRDDVQIARSPGLITRFAGFNCRVEPFDDVRVRQALNYAADTQTIVNELYTGMSEPAASFFAPDVQYNTDDVPTYEHDPERAMELLEEAGYGDGFEFDWMVPRVGRFTGPTEVLQANFQEIGVEANLDIRESGTYTETVIAGEDHEEQMFFHSLSQTPSPDVFLATTFHSENVPPEGGNYWHYENEDVDAWIEEATTAADDDRREELFGDIQRTINEECPGIWVDHELFVFAMHDFVSGYESDPQRRMEFEQTTLDE